MVSETFLNGERADSAALGDVAVALADPRILQEKGGYLFKALLEGQRLHLGIIPGLSFGVRGHHYDIRIPGDESDMLIGSVDANGSFTVLFKPNSRDIGDEARETYRSTFVSLAVCLIDAGYSGNGDLDSVTRQLIASAGIYTPAPESLAALYAMASC